MVQYPLILARAANGQRAVFMRWPRSFPSGGPLPDAADQPRDRSQAAMTGNPRNRPADFKAVSRHG